MKYRTLGRTGLTISEIGFGCGTGAGLMVEDEPEKQMAAVARALERGVNYFDTAPIYGEFRSETNLGRTLRALGAAPVLATKVALEPEVLGDIAAAVVASVEGSLERLQRDSIDIVYLHNRIASERAVKPEVGVGSLLTVEDVLGPGGVVSGFESLRKRGLVKSFGCCAYGGDMGLLERVIDSDTFDALLVHYSALTQTAWLPTVPGSSVPDYARIAARAAARGMGTVVLRVLEAGLLAGNSRELPRVRNANAARSNALADLQGNDATLLPLAIRFALSNAEVSTVLIGVSDISHVDDAVDAAECGVLTEVVMQQIERTRQADFSGGTRALHT
jgi:aryl-alcohol dehydrogenase-like predicted oxidoreductase